MEKNELYPIFLKVAELNVLIVGGGNVAHEKLEFLLKSSPNANVTVVAPYLNPETKLLMAQFDVKFIKKYFSATDLDKKHIVIATTNNTQTNHYIYTKSKEKQLLVNVADTPLLCDFYLGGIVTKGHVKIAISTNGKSPTSAKRLRQFFESVIPENIDDLVQNLNLYRQQIKGSFSSKVSALNKLTKSLITEAI